MFFSGVFLFIQICVFFCICIIVGFLLFTRSLCSSILFLIPFMLNCMIVCLLLVSLWFGLETVVIVLC